MTFEAILPLIKQGQKVIRQGWSGYEQYVVLVTDDRRDNTPITPYLLIKTADEGFSMFQPTVCDLFADDWQVVADCV